MEQKETLIMTEHKTLVLGREDLMPRFKDIELEAIKLEHVHTDFRRALHTASIIMFSESNGNTKILKDRFATIFQKVYYATKVTT